MQMALASLSELQTRGISGRPGCRGCAVAFSAMAPAGLGWPAMPACV
jgi:hypothetical protein